MSELSEKLWQTGSMVEEYNPAGMREELHGLAEEVMQLESALAEKEEELRRAEEVIRFYAERMNHLRPEFPPVSPVEQDAGQRARTWLADNDQHPNRDICDWLSGRGE